MHNTLKDRIKRNMEPAASSSLGRGPNRRASLLDAASALASLGGDALTASLGLLPGSGGGAPASSLPATRQLYTNEAGMMQPGNAAESDGGSSYREISLDSMMLSHHHQQQQQQQPPLALPSSNLRGDIPMTFPEKLMEVLDNEEISDVITWLPHGKGFVILQKRKFASEVMPMYFKQSKFTSFTRKLNRWGFTRVTATTGDEAGAYFHKYFQRGNTLLCMQMHCQATGTTTKPSKLSPRSSPTPKSSPSPSVQHDDPTTNRAADDDMSIEMSSLQGHAGDTMPAFDEVLLRQRQILREAQEEQRKNNSSHSPMSDEAYDRQQDILRSTQYQKAASQYQVTKQYQASLCRPCLPRDVMQAEHQHRPRFDRSYNEVDQVGDGQRMYHQGTLQSRQHHRYIMESTLNGLESRSGRVGPVDYARRQEYEPTAPNDHTSGMSPPKLQAQAQLLHNVEGVGPNTQGSSNMPSPMLRAKLHSAMENRLRQLQDHNQSVGDALMVKKSDQYPRLSSQDIALLRQRWNPDSSSSQSYPGSRVPRGVRRASAA